MIETRCFRQCGAKVNIWCNFSIEKRNFKSIVKIDGLNDPVQGSFSTLDFNWAGMEDYEDTIYKVKQEKRGVSSKPRLLLMTFS